MLSHTRSGKLDNDRPDSLENHRGNKAKVAKLLSVGQITLYRFLGTNEDVC